MSHVKVAAAQRLAPSGGGEAHELLTLLAGGAGRVRPRASRSVAGARAHHHAALGPLGGRLPGYCMGTWGVEGVKSVRILNPRL